MKVASTVRRKADESNAPRDSSLCSDGLSVDPTKFWGPK